MAQIYLRINLVNIRASDQGVGGGRGERGNEMNSMLSPSKIRINHYTSLKTFRFMLCILKNAQKRKIVMHICQGFFKSKVVSEVNLQL